MDENVEITELLREIRDLQKAHFDRYVAFGAARSLGKVKVLP
jgi:hypothetical protein